MKNAIGFVDWNTFRGGHGERSFERSYYYASSKDLLGRRVGDGGTLWLVTNRGLHGRDGRPRYHLAYKIVGCTVRPNPPSRIVEAYRKRNKTVCMVESARMDACEHYPANDITAVLRSVEPVDGRRFGEYSNLGMKLQSFPELTPASVARLEGFAFNVLSERIVFLSYAHRDRARAERLVRELDRRNVKVFRDVDRLKGGDRFERELATAVRGSDIFLVLASKASAGSKWVRRELKWAKAELETGGVVQRIFPLLLTGSPWADFPELQEFHRIEHPMRPGTGFYDTLARQLTVIPRHRRVSWAN